MMLAFPEITDEQLCDAWQAATTNAQQRARARHDWDDFCLARRKLFALYVLKLVEEEEDS